jgi:outer membrane protein OmpA-like peptidoglycan-associated protein
MTVPQLKAALHVEDTGQGLRIELPADLLFGDAAGDAIGSQADTMLEEAARLIAAAHPREVLVAGHTDGAGRDDDNLTLSERRAHAVAAWLQQRAGKGRAPRFVEKGYGRTRPIAPNHNPDGSDSPDGRRQNRRVELYLRG